MKKLFSKIINFLNAPTLDDELKERFYKKLEDMKNHPEKYQRIFHDKSESAKIPPISLF